MNDSPLSSTSAQIDTETQARNAAAKKVIFLTVFLDMLGFGIVMPQLAVYATQFGASPDVVGYLASTYSLMGFLFTPFWGRLSDRIGRRPVMLYSIFGTAVGYVLFGFSGSLVLLFAARMVDGITAGNISTAQAYLSDITPAADRAKTFGLFGAIFGIGFAIGPAIGSLISELPGVWGGNLGLGLITATLSFINWGMAVVRLPETLHPDISNANKERDAGKRIQIINFHGFRRALELPGIKIVVWISFFATTAFATMQGTYTTFLITKYIRPQVQTLIRTTPEAALTEAARDTALVPTTAKPVSADESATVGVAEGGINAPYPAAMGGDIAGGDTMTRIGLTLRRVEKELVRPRASRLSARIFATIGLSALLIQGLLVAPLKNKLGEINMVLAGTLLMALALALVPIPTTVFGEFPVMALLALGNSVATPVLTSLVSELAPEHERGEIMGVYQSIGSLGRIFGPNIGGQLFNRIAPGAPFFSGGFIMLISLAMAFRLRAYNPEAQRAKNA